MNAFIITQLFMGVLSMSLTAALIGLLLTAIRPFTEKYFSKKWNYYIWLLVVARLAVPIHYEADFLHLLNFHADIRQTQPAAPVHSETVADAYEDSAAPVTAIPINAAPAKPQTDRDKQDSSDTAQKPIRSFFTMTSILKAAAHLWLIGAFLSLFFRLWSYYRFQSAIRKDCVRITNHPLLCLESSFCAGLGIHEIPVIYESAAVHGPITVGLWKPAIVIPKEIPADNMMQFQLVLHHELIHVARKDLLYKWVYQILRCIHWFNPLLHWFGRQMSRDCELSCDEAILTHLTDSGRMMYGNILLDAAEHSISRKHDSLSTTLLENKKDLKKRLDNIQSHGKRTRFQLGLSACTLVIVLSLSACSSIWITMNDKSEPEQNQSSDVPEDETYEVASADRSPFRQKKSSLFSQDSFLDNFSKAHKYGNAWNVYDDDTLIAAKDDFTDNWGAYNYYGGQNLTASKMVLYGSSTIVIAYADKDIQVDVTSSFEIVEGKFKIVSVAPDGTVTTINDTGADSVQTITMKEGRNAIKMVGQGAKLKSLTLNYSDMNITDFEDVYFSEEEEYFAHLDRTVEAGEPIDKDKVMDALYTIPDSKEVSNVFHILLVSGISLTSSELCDFLYCSDGEPSSKYLVEAIADGYQKPLSPETVSAVMPYFDDTYKAQLLAQLPAESFYETLENNLFYLTSAQIEECLGEYLLNGGTLSNADFSEISFYLDESAIERLSAMLQNKSNAT